MWDYKNQQIHIKPFIGASQNAVMIQIWRFLLRFSSTALKAQAEHPWYLSNLLVLIRLILFVKVDLHGWLDNPFQKEQPPPNKQMQEVIGFCLCFGRN